ncbi:hypothetical protein BM1_10929 [Bipolaris maydis]|nr:hypothetical protein BM1_10929 [Bipolaris maydis]
MQPIDAALAAIDALKPNEKLVYSQIAKKYGVDPGTLSRRHRVHPQHEAELIDYIDRLTKRGLPPTRSIIRNIASQLAQKQLGYHWVDRFVYRNSHLIILKRTTPIDCSRRQADSEKKYQLYFELLRQKIDQYKVEPRHIYNMDEKGFMIGVQSRSVRIFSKAALQSKLKRSNIQDGNREWITLIACICADGSYLDLSIIYSSKSSSIQNSWL